MRRKFIVYLFFAKLGTQAQCDMALKTFPEGGDLSSSEPKGKHNDPDLQPTHSSQAVWRHATWSANDESMQMRAVGEWRHKDDSLQPTHCCSMLQQQPQFGLSWKKEPFRGRCNGRTKLGVSAGCGELVASSDWT